MRPAGVKLTYDDFLLFPDVGCGTRSARSTSGWFTRPVELSRETNEVLTTSLLPGLELPLARLFRE